MSWDEIRQAIYERAARLPDRELERVDYAVDIIETALGINPTGGK